jgi:hypothetical protein
MEIKIATKQLLKILQVISWIIFIGLCIEAGSIIFNTFFALFISPVSASNFWEGTELSNLYNYDRGHFAAFALIMIIISILKSLMFFLIVKMFTEKKLDLHKPFSNGFRRFIQKLSSLALGIGLFCIYGMKYYARMSGNGVPLPDAQSLHMAGGDVWLFMAVILFVITQIVKSGIEMQAENDLTI